ncbi:hypothetical protein [Gemmobacter denitrificans]|uniref:Lipoprotein n=1 Tax=Gemmobacter denitrificans TaxID=3123040 RepID=A0ABU8BTH8_9RHOB
MSISILKKNISHFCICIASSAILAACAPETAYSYFLINAENSIEIRMRVSKGIIGSVEEIGASCGVYSKERFHTKCNFEGKNRLASIDIFAPPVGDLKVFIREVRGVFLPVSPDKPFEESVSDFYLELEKVVLSNIPTGSSFTAKRNFVGGSLPDQELPIHN